VTLLLVLLCFPAVGHATETQLKEGNRLFRAGKYEEALKKYNDALIDTPQSSILKFNAADASYQSGDLPGAEKRFADVAEETPLPVLKGAARYNQGNALYRQGKWQEAVDAYKDSLRANPRDEDAKYNLGVALNTLRNPPKPQPKSGSGKNDKNQKGSGSKGGAKPSDMSQQDAERLLAAAAASEQKKKAQAPKSGVPKPDEDW